MRKHSRTHIRHQRERVINKWERLWKDLELSTHFCNYPYCYHPGKWDGQHNRWNKYAGMTDYDMGYWSKLSHHPRYRDERAHRKAEWQRIERWAN